MTDPALLRVAVSTPFPVSSTQGNSVSARRIAGLLNKAGIESTAVENAPTHPVDCLIAINAWRSSETIRNFVHRSPRGKVIVVLAGSDLYKVGLSQCEDALNAADLLVLAQPSSFDALPPELAAKCTIIPKSVDISGVAPRPRKDTGLLAVILSHLKTEKNPMLAVQAAEDIDGRTNLVFELYGNDIDSTLTQAITEASPSNFAWKGSVSHSEALSILASADLLLNTSDFEGGANAVCEAVALGVPVLATDIPGNAGILGNAYPGLFPKGNAKELSRLIQRCLSDNAFLADLRTEMVKIRPSLAPEHEREKWVSAVLEPLAQQLP